MSQFSTTGPVGSSANNDGVAIATKTGVKVEGDQVTLSNSSGNAIGANDNGTGTHHTVEMAGDTIQLMGMAGSLPTSNLYVNYPHTMWEKDAEGNRIPVQVIKQEGSGVDTPDDVVNPDDLLSQATASIKQEHGVIIRTLPNDEESAGSGATPAPQRKQPTQLGPDGQPLPRPHLCEVCQKTFVKREHLTKHLRIHKNDNKRYSCEYCQKAFRDRYELVRHTRRHTGDFPFRCNECNKGFMRHERYMTHIRWHTGERPYQCSMCEKSFRDRSELNRHSRRHTGDLPYKCETCGKGFLRRERYVTHVRIHTGEKPFVCAVCSRGYRDKRELKKHQISHNHSGQSAPIPGVQPSPQASTSAGPTAIMTNQGINSHMNVSHALGSPEPKTIIVQQSISLPNQPVPRELLNLNGNVQQVVQHQPLNPATIPLPPSVASALQSINEKVAAKQAKMAAAKLMSQTPVPPQTITIAKQDNSAGQLVAIPSNATIATSGGGGNGANGSGPLYYYVMPGSVPYSISSEGGTTVRLTTTEGNVTTAQLVSVPSGVLQGIQNGGGNSTNTNSMTAALPSWILDGSGVPPADPTSADTTTTTVIIQQGDGVQPDSIVTVEEHSSNATEHHSSAVSRMPMIATSLGGHHQGIQHVRKADEEAAARELLQLKTTMPMALTKDLTNGYVLVPGNASASGLTDESGHRRLIVKVPEMGLTENHVMHDSSITIPNLDGNLTDEASDSEDEAEVKPGRSSSSLECHRTKLNPPTNECQEDIPDASNTTSLNDKDIPSGNNTSERHPSTLSTDCPQTNKDSSVSAVGVISGSRTVIVSSPASKLKPTCAPQRHSIKSLLGVDDDSSGDENPSPRETPDKCPPIKCSALASDSEKLHEAQAPSTSTSSSSLGTRPDAVLNLSTKKNETSPSSPIPASVAHPTNLVQSVSIPSSSIDVVQSPQSNSDPAGQENPIPNPPQHDLPSVSGCQVSQIAIKEQVKSDSKSQNDVSPLPLLTEGASSSIVTPLVSQVEKAVVAPKNEVELERLKNETEPPKISNKCADPHGGTLCAAPLQAISSEESVQVSESVKNLSTSSDVGTNRSKKNHNSEEELPPMTSDEKMPPNQAEEVSSPGVLDHTAEETSNSPNDHEVEEGSQNLPVDDSKPTRDCTLSLISQPALERSSGVEESSKLFPTKVPETSTSEDTSGAPLMLSKSPGHQNESQDVPQSPSQVPNLAEDECRDRLGSPDPVEIQCSNDKELIQKCNKKSAATEAVGGRKDDKVRFPSEAAKENAPWLEHIEPTVSQPEVILEKEEASNLGERTPSPQNDSDQSESSNPSISLDSEVMLASIAAPPTEPQVKKIDEKPEEITSEHIVQVNSIETLEKDDDTRKTVSNTLHPTGKEKDAEVLDSSGEINATPVMKGPDPSVPPSTPNEPIVKAPETIEEVQLDGNLPLTSPHIFARSPRKDVEDAPQIAVSSDETLVAQEPTSQSSLIESTSALTVVPATLSTDKDDLKTVLCPSDGETRERVQNEVFNPLNVECNDRGVGEEKTQAVEKSQSAKPELEEKVQTLQSDSQATNIQGNESVEKHRGEESLEAKDLPRPAMTVIENESITRLEPDVLEDVKLIPTTNEVQSSEKLEAEAEEDTQLGPPANNEVLRPGTIGLEAREDAKLGLVANDDVLNQEEIVPGAGDGSGPPPSSVDDDSSPDDLSPEQVRLERDEDSKLALSTGEVVSSEKIGCEADEDSKLAPATEAEASSSEEIELKKEGDSKLAPAHAVAGASSSEDIGIEAEKASSLSPATEKILSPGKIVPLDDEDIKFSHSSAEVSSQEKIGLETKDDPKPTPVIETGAGASSGENIDLETECDSHLSPSSIKGLSPKQIKLDTEGPEKIESEGKNDSKSALGTAVDALSSVKIRLERDEDSKIAQSADVVLSAEQIGHEAHKDSKIAPATEADALSSEKIGPKGAEESSFAPTTEDDLSPEKIKLDTDADAKLDPDTEADALSPKQFKSIGAEDSKLTLPPEADALSSDKIGPKAAEGSILAPATEVDASSSEKIVSKAADDSSLAPSTENDLNPDKSRLETNADAKLAPDTEADEVSKVVQPLIPQIITERLCEENQSTAIGLDKAADSSTNELGVSSEKNHDAGVLDESEGKATFSKEISTTISTQNSATMVEPIGAAKASQMLVGSKPEDDGQTTEALLQEPLQAGKAQTIENNEHFHPTMGEDTSTTAGVHYNAIQLSQPAPKVRAHSNCDISNEQPLTVETPDVLRVEKDPSPGVGDPLTISPTLTFPDDSLMKVRQDEANDDDDEEDEEEDEDDEEEEDRSSSALSHATSSSVSSFVHEAPAINSQPFKTINQVGGQFVPEDYGQPGESAPNLVLSSIGTVVSVPPFAENNNGLNSENPLGPDPSGGSTARPLVDLTVQAKRGKSAPHVCQYCQREYKEKHRYDVHIRFHTGEKPYTCPTCHKGFREQRKLNLHVARHNSSLGHKCHLCPRSFEGPKALNKHLDAHKNNRYVAPKVFKKADGTIAMVLPEDHNYKKTGASGPDSIGDQGSQTSSPVPPISQPPMSSSVEAPLGMAIPLPCAEAEAIPSASGDQGTISLSMDDLMQYATPLPPLHEQSHHHHHTTVAPDLEERLIDNDGGKLKIVPVGMEEFMRPTGASLVSSIEGGVVALGTREAPIVAYKSSQPITATTSAEPSSGLNDSGEFPDLLDSEHSLTSLDYRKFNSEENKPTVKDETSGLTFTTLSCPQFPSEAERPSPPEPPPPMVVARKSAPVITFKKTDGKGNSKAQDFIKALTSEAVAQLSKAKINLPPGTCLVPADATYESISGTSSELAAAIATASTNCPDGLKIIPTAGLTTSTALPQDGMVRNKPMTITIQYKIFPDSQGQPQKIAVQRELADLINEAPSQNIISPVVSTEGMTTGGSMTDSSSISSTVSSPVPPNTTLASSSLGAQSLTTAQVPPLPVGDPLFKDPAKETRMVISARGQKFEIPTIVTSGYDLDNLMCTFCNKGFKNDKTLMGHMLNHFGVTPKMAHCPICGLTLQKKSYARHLRLHGNVVPEMCPYCQKEFREKRSLEKHIRAVHQADRPYPCNHCEARFKSLMDQTNHSQMHLNDFPHKCHVCGLTFEDVHSLGSHYKLHSGVKPFTCDICGKSFTSEKNKRVHVLRHQGSLPFKCDVCNMTFQLQSQLSKHAASHTRKTEVISAKINTFLESFTASLENDMLGLEEGFDADQTVSLTDDTSLEAAAAEAAFVFGQNDLTEELLGETGDESVTSMSSFGAGNEFTIPDTKEGEPLQCQTCQMVLKNKRSYIIHMKRHAGLLKFKCRYCPRTFQGNSKLNRHLRVHVREGTNITPPPPGEMSHKAPTLSIQEIGERVSTPGSSKHVMREQEVSVETIKCALCPKTFTDNESLQTHTLVHFQGNANERKIDSNLLKEKLLSRKRPIKYKALTKVQKVASVMFHPFTYKCTLCDVDLPSKSSRAVHNIVKHKRRSWKCKFCSTLFFNRTQLLDHLEADHKVDKEEIQMLGILKKASIFSVHRKPYKPPLPPSPSPPPTPIGSGSGTGDGISPSPSLKFIHNEELFDNANLTCLACNKAFKNARAFKLHCDRHQGTLKHKCPECVKSFNGRSEVNRHCIAIHSRPLGHNEETVQRCGSASANYDQGPRVVANFSLPAELTNELGTVHYQAPDGTVYRQDPSSGLLSDASRCSTALSDPGFEFALAAANSYVESQEADSSKIMQQKDKLIAMMQQKLVEKAFEKKKKKKDKVKKDKRKRSLEKEPSVSESESISQVDNASLPDASASGGLTISMPLLSSESHEAPASEKEKPRQMPRKGAPPSKDLPSLGLMDSKLAPDESDQFSVVIRKSKSHVSEEDRMKSEMEFDKLISSESSKPKATKSKPPMESEHPSLETHPKAVEALPSNKSLAHMPMILGDSSEPIDDPVKVAENPNSDEMDDDLPDLLATDSPLDPRDEDETAPGVEVKIPLATEAPVTVSEDPPSSSHSQKDELKLIENPKDHKVAAPTEIGHDSKGDNLGETSSIPTPQVAIESIEDSSLTTEQRTELPSPDLITTSNRIPDETKTGQKAIRQGDSNSPLKPARELTIPPPDLVTEPKTSSENDPPKEPKTSSENDSSEESKTTSENDTPKEPKTSSENDTSMEPKSTSENDTSVEPKTTSENDTPKEPKTSSENDTSMESKTTSENDTSTTDTDDGSEDARARRKLRSRPANALAVVTPKPKKKNVSVKEKNASGKERADQESTLKKDAAKPEEKLVAKVKTTPKKDASPKKSLAIFKIFQNKAADKDQIDKERERNREKRIQEEEDLEEGRVKLPKKTSATSHFEKEREHNQEKRFKEKDDLEERGVKVPTKSSPTSQSKRPRGKRALPLPPTPGSRSSLRNKPRSRATSDQDEGKEYGSDQHDGDVASEIQAPEDSPPKSEISCQATKVEDQVPATVEKCEDEPIVECKPSLKQEARGEDVTEAIPVEDSKVQSAPELPRSISSEDLASDSSKVEKSPARRTRKSKKPAEIESATASATDPNEIPKVESRMETMKVDPIVELPTLESNRPAPAEESVDAPPSRITRGRARRVSQPKQEQTEDEKIEPLDCVPETAAERASSESHPPTDFGHITSKAIESIKKKSPTVRIHPLNEDAIQRSIKGEQIKPEDLLNSSPTRKSSRVVPKVESERVAKSSLAAPSEASTPTEELKPVVEVSVPVPITPPVTQAVVVSLPKVSQQVDPGQDANLPVDDQSSIEVKMKPIPVSGPRKDEPEDTKVVLPEVDERSLPPKRRGRRTAPPPVLATEPEAVEEPVVPESIPLAKTNDKSTDAESEPPMEESSARPRRRKRSPVKILESAEIKVQPTKVKHSSGVGSPECDQPEKPVVAEPKKRGRPRKNPIQSVVPKPASPKLVRSSSETSRRAPSKEPDTVKAVIPDEVPEPPLIDLSKTSVQEPPKVEQLPAPSQAAVPGAEKEAPLGELNIPAELCRIETGRGNKHKLTCQICHKTFLRKDKINCHIYSEHQEEIAKLEEASSATIQKTQIDEPEVVQELEATPQSPEKEKDITTPTDEAVHPVVEELKSPKLSLPKFLPKGLKKIQKKVAQLSQGFTRLLQLKREKVRWRKSAESQKVLARLKRNCRFKVEQFKKLEPAAEEVEETRLVGKAAEERTNKRLVLRLEKPTPPWFASSLSKLTPLKLKLKCDNPEAAELIKAGSEPGKGGPSMRKKTSTPPPPLASEAPSQPDQVKEEPMTRKSKKPSTTTEVQSEPVKASRPSAKDKEEERPPKYLPSPGTDKAPKAQPELPIKRSRSRKSSNPHKIEQVPEIPLVCRDIFGVPLRVTSPDEMGIPQDGQSTSGIATTSDNPPAIQKETKTEAAVEPLNQAKVPEEHSGPKRKARKRKADDNTPEEVQESPDKTQTLKLGSESGEARSDHFPSSLEVDQIVPINRSRAKRNGNPIEPKENRSIPSNDMEPVPVPKKRGRPRKNLEERAISKPPKDAVDHLASAPKNLIEKSESSEATQSAKPAPDEIKSAPTRRGRQKREKESLTKPTEEQLPGEISRRTRARNISSSSSARGGPSSGADLSPVPLDPEPHATPAPAGPGPSKRGKQRKEASSATKSASPPVKRTRKTSDTLLETDQNITSDADIQKNSDPTPASEPDPRDQNDTPGSTLAERVSEEKENSVKGIKLVIKAPVSLSKSPDKELHHGDEVKPEDEAEPKYVVQSSVENPLKLKLTSGIKKKKKKRARDSKDDEESVDKIGVKHKKHKKRKHKEKEDEDDEESAASPPVVLRLKSPNALDRGSTSSPSRSSIERHLSPPALERTASRAVGQKAAGAISGSSSEKHLSALHSSNPINQVSISERSSALSSRFESQSSQALGSTSVSLTATLVVPSAPYTTSTTSGGGVRSSSSFNRSASSLSALPFKTVGAFTDNTNSTMMTTSGLPGGNLNPRERVAEQHSFDSNNKGSGRGREPPASSSVVTFSPDSSPEHNPTLPTFGDETLGLNEGTFNKILKSIGEEDEPESPSLGAPSNLHRIGASEKAGKSSLLLPSVEQVDGSVDTYSRASTSVCSSASPRVSEEEEGDNKHLLGEDKPKRPRKLVHAGQNIIQQRMKQTSVTVKPKNKSALIFRVFKTSSKYRKIVAVKNRKPQFRIYELHEFNVRTRKGTLDEPYDEDQDDPQVSKERKRPPTKEPKDSGSPVKMSQSPAAGPSAESHSFGPPEDSEPDENKMDCSICKRTFPNLIRAHAHRQMHLAEQKRKIKRSKSKDTFSTSSASSSRRTSLDESVGSVEEHESMMISQVDGETDLDVLMESLGPPPQSTVVVSSVSNPISINSHLLSSGSSSASQVMITTTSTNMRHAPGNVYLGTSSTGGNPMHVVILKKNNPVLNGIPMEQQQSVSTGMTVYNTIQHSAGTTTCSGSSGVLLSNKFYQHQQQIPRLVQTSQPNSVSFVQTMTPPSVTRSASAASSSSSSSCSQNLSTFAKELLVSDSAHPMLIKQDPVMMSNERDDHDLILPDTLHLFEGTNLDHGTDPIHLSIDDIASFAQPMCAADGSQASFDTSIETASFLSGADALDIASETTNGTASLSLPEIRSESGTPSLPDDGEFPCGQCDKKFGNRRNLVSHMRRHTGDYKLFCLDCNKGFFTQSKLDSHKRKHTGEKPFRCLFKPCLKRFRYKGDLSKHIKRYHPGHVQELVPIPLQEDEMATLQQNMANAAMKKTTITSVSATVTNASALPVAGPSKATITEVVPSQQPARSSSNSLFFPLLPQHPVKPSELQSINNGSTGSSQTNGNGMRSPSATPTFVIQHHHQQSSSDDNNDPSLDENIIEMLTADDDDESSSHGEVCGFQSPSPNPSVESFKTSTPILHNVLTKGAITIKNEMRKDQEQHHPPNQPPSELLQVRQPQYSIAQIPTSKPNHIVVSAPVATTTVSSFLVPSAALLKPIMLQSSQRTTASGIKFTLPSAPLPTSSHATANSVHIGPKSVISLMSSNVIQRPNISISPASLVRKSSTKAAILRSASTPTQPMGMNIQEVLAKSQPVPMDESQHPGQPRSLATTKPATATSSSVPPIQIQVSGHAAHDSSSMSATAMLPGRSAKPFPCSFSGCMRSFEKSNLLRRHMKLHSGDCKFVCDICKKCFESQSKLDDHYRKHTGEKPFVCPICGNTFRYKGDRTKHLKNLHGVTKMTSLSTSTSSTASTSSSTTSEDKLGFFANLSQDETNSSLSSFHSNSDSLASGSVVLESPVKVENMEVINLNQVSQHHDDDDLNVMEGMQETVTMSLDEVVQFAQPIVTDYY